MSYNSKYTGAEVEALLDAASGKQDKITDLDAIRSGAAAGATALQSVPAEYVTETELTNKGYATTSALENKVDKVFGKQLSTEDFTTALKEKLEGLSNYNDEEISAAVSSLQIQIDYLVSGNANDAINSFNEIIAFLDGVKDTQDLAGIIASIEQQIAAKQTTISDLDTIRSGAALGATALQSYTEKYTGTYSKPSGGIPKTDLASSVQTSLEKADTALQSYTEQYKGTVTGVKINNTTKNPSSGVVDLGTVITAHQDISGKADKSSLATVATSGSYNDLSNKPTIPAEQVNADWNATSGKAQILNKPTIPSAVTESTVSGWGFTKNAGTITGIKMNGASKGTSGVVDLGTVITAHQDISGKQDKLVSGTNIKTINGTSILGSGDITISGGGGGTITGVSANGTSIATSGVANIPAASTSAYGVTKLSSATNSTSTTLAATASAVKSAYDLANSFKGTVTGVKINGTTKSPTSGTVDLGTVITSHQDISGKQDKLVSGTNIKTINGTSILGSGNITISGGSSGGGSGAYAQVNHGTSDTTFTLTPNTFHVWDEVSALTLSLGDETAGVANEFVFQFTSGATPTSLTLPDSIKWVNDSAPTIAENKIYQISILNGLAVCLEFNKKVELVDNKLTITNGMMDTTFTFQYPVASDVTIIVYASGFGGNTSITISKGSQTLTKSFGPGNTTTLVSITPANDNIYRYI